MCHQNMTDAGNYPRQLRHTFSQSCGKQRELQKYQSSEQRPAIVKMCRDRDVVLIVVTLTGKDRDVLLTVATGRN